MFFDKARKAMFLGFARLSVDQLTRAWAIVALGLLAWFVVTGVLSLVDDRSLDGANVWAKPMKFSVSLSLHLFTLAILAQQLPGPSLKGLGMRVVGYAVIVAAAFEQTYITLQASLGRRSHFNFDSQLEIVLYQLMGVGALILVFGSFFLGMKIWLGGRKDNSAFRLGTILGLTFGSIMTLVVAGYLSSNGSHWVGVGSGDGVGLPVVGWSREVGDLRVSHFFATHMIQILPFMGFYMDQRHLARHWLWPALVVLLCVVIALFVMARAGLPLIGL